MSTGITTLTVTSPSGETLQDFLASRIGLSKNKAKALLDSRSVLVNRRRVWMARHTVRRGDVVEVMAQPASATATGEPAIEVLVEVNDFLVVDKPAGLLANGPHSVETRLRAERSEPSIRAAHRLDRDTSGCLLIARNPAAFDGAVAMFRERDVGKSYRAIVAGRMGPGSRDISFPLDGLTARTRVSVISSAREASYLAVEIETGRTHQIRRHLAMVGHPVLGDRQHWTRRAVSDRQVAVARQMLHARELLLPNPVEGTVLHAVAPLPLDFVERLRRFGLRDG